MPGSALPALRHPRRHQQSHQLLQLRRVVLLRRHDGSPARAAVHAAGPDASVQGTHVVVKAMVVVSHSSLLKFGKTHNSHARAHAQCPFLSALGVVLVTYVTPGPSIPKRIQRLHFYLKFASNNYIVILD